MAKLPLTIQETVQALGVSESTVRRMLTEKILEEHSRGPKGRILIKPESVEAAAIALGRQQILGSELRRELAPSMTALAEAVQALITRMQDQEDRIREKDAQLLRLAEQLGEARAEARLLPVRAEHAEQRAALLERQVDDLRSEVERIRQENAQLRADLASGPYSKEQPTNQAELLALMQQILNRVQSS
jgi:chromosome segregation ATPase